MPTTTTTTIIIIIIIIRFVGLEIYAARKYALWELFV
jgi:hypothetical protein